MSRLYDISQPLRADIPVWPGDTPFAHEPTWVLGEQCPVNVSRLVLSTHTGTHADAPSHYAVEGRTIDAVDLACYIGLCVVLDMTHAGPRVEPGHLLPVLSESVERVLLRTWSRFPHEEWRSDFTTIAAESIDLLAERGARLIGVDAPSLDPEVDSALLAHRRVHHHGMAILEGLVLDAVPPGHYELIAPPLKLAGGDAAPVRALLRELEQ
ncbi:arylformamidase [Billgrantia bachuensis]|uniref:Kynurenine formamidase n=1 Tax=Billgrantia bachuensis TaxID=2717286 RepID=A0ABX0PRR5_9GAMM|nr:arylformamidase [Halomonas bachuensis]NIC05609.1 arylformamidase [Halomonas bachuensis]